MYAMGFEEKAFSPFETHAKVANNLLHTSHACERHCPTVRLAHVSCSQRRQPAVLQRTSEGELAKAEGHTEVEKMIPDADSLGEL